MERRTRGLVVDARLALGVALGFFGRTGALAFAGLDLAGLAFAGFALADFGFVGLARAGFAFVAAVRFAGRVGSGAERKSRRVAARRLPAAVEACVPREPAIRR